MVWMFQGERKLDVGQVYGVHLWTRTDKNSVSDVAKYLVSLGWLGINLKAIPGPTTPTGSDAPDPNTVHYEVRGTWEGPAKLVLPAEDDQLVYGPLFITTGPGDPGEVPEHPPDGQVQPPADGGKPPAPSPPSSAVPIGIAIAVLALGALVVVKGHTERSN